jgi:hypothetical protein
VLDPSGPCLEGSGAELNDPHRDEGGGEQWISSELSYLKKCPVKLESLQYVLNNCMPYNDATCPENASLIDTGIDVGNELVRFLTAIKNHREGKPERETDAIRIHAAAPEMFRLLLEINEYMINSSWDPPWRQDLHALATKLGAKIPPSASGDSQ